MTTENVAIRQSTREDFEQIIDYFLNATPAFLNGMGVDPQKIPPKEKWIEGFITNSERSDAEKDRLFITWLLEGQPVGHSNINDIVFGEEAFIHLHLWKSDHRKSGLGTRFFRLSAEYFAKRFKLKKIFCEPYAENPAPNKTLLKVGFRFLKRYETIPGLISFRQEVNLYELNTS